MSFNAAITVTELLTKTLENCAKDLAVRCINECALRHGFDAQEEIRILGLENLALIKKQMAKKSKGPKAEKQTKAKKSPAFPLPFIAGLVNHSACHGLAYNRGLFTQCSKKIMDNGHFCKACQSEADKNASGIPDCGTIEQRLATGLYDFKDSKGRSPVSYTKILKKLEITSETAAVHAATMNSEIDDLHFTYTPVKKSSTGNRGRPKKQTTIVEADNVTDLFGKLTAEIDDEAIPEEEPKVQKHKLTDEEKAIKKAALEAERAEKKLQRETQAAIDKAEREKVRKAESELKKLEREHKIAVERALREEKRLQEKAEKEKKKAQEKAEKEAEKEAKKGVKKSVKDVQVEAPVVVPNQKITVSRKTINGREYFVSGTNIVYSIADKEEVGIWDPATNTIKELPVAEENEEEAEDEEEEEEEYEEDDDADLI